ncbi:MAG: hypothetical protein AAGE52_03725 [Myxococcota bacterium]
MRWLLLCGVLVACSGSESSTPSTSAQSTNAQSTNAAPSPAEIDRTYCERYDARKRECFPGVEESSESYIARCVARYEAERASDTFSAAERADLERCIALPTCEAVTECMRRPSKAEPPAPGMGITRDAWIAQMRVRVPRMFCAPDQFFRQCFRIDEAQCVEEATTTTNACLEQHQGSLPDRLGPQEGAHWGQVVGSCSGTQFEASLLSVRISNPRCNDVRNWI